MKEIGDTCSRSDRRYNSKLGIPFMIADWTPLRWPSAWKSASDLDLLQGTPINCLLDVDGPIAEQARARGITVLDKGAAPPGVTVLEGIWPGIRMARFGASNAFSAGPTGDPWVNSNIWPVRLAQARNPGATVWIGQTGRPARLSNITYTTAVADAALTGGRWIISIDNELAGGIQQRSPAAIALWTRINSAATYFAQRRVWTDYRPEAVVGVVSAFATSVDQEVLNLITRSGQQYRVIPVERLNASQLQGLRAVIVPDKDLLPPPARAQLTAFVKDGGLLIAQGAWNPDSAAIARPEAHPRFTFLALGQGTLALAKVPFNDPYILASDAAVIISHRHDLLRFWNGGALSAYYSAAPGRRRAVVQLLFYADRPAEDVSIRIAGPFRSASLSTFEHPEPRSVPTENQQGGIAIQLPPVGQYAAIELE